MSRFPGTHDAEPLTYTAPKNRFYSNRRHSARKTLFSSCHVAIRGGHRVFPLSGRQLVVGRARTPLTRSRKHLENHQHGRQSYTFSLPEMILNLREGSLPRRFCPRLRSQNEQKRDSRAYDPSPRRSARSSPTILGRPRQQNGMQKKDSGHEQPLLIANMRTLYFICWPVAGGKKMEAEKEGLPRQVTNEQCGILLDPSIHRSRCQPLRTVSWIQSG